VGARENETGSSAMGNASGSGRGLEWPRTPSNCTCLGGIVSPKCRSGRRGELALKVGDGALLQWKL
jgi:hypothetical protein